uniref:Uncharacterized protein n=1 Tax=Aegilops tauschii subsp. strangulata TaxID=200361 RepID=A0A453NT33_AEGTS
MARASTVGWGRCVGRGCVWRRARWRGRPRRRWWGVPGVAAPIRGSRDLRLLSCVRQRGEMAATWLGRRAGCWPGWCSPACSGAKLV